MWRVEFVVQPEGAGASVAATAYDPAGVWGRL